MSRDRRVVFLIDDLLPENWQDIFTFPVWPDLMPDLQIGLSPGRWRQLQRFARTAKERAILELLASGDSAMDIAEQMHRTPAAVRIAAKKVFARALLTEGCEPPAGGAL